MAHHSCCSTRKAPTRQSRSTNELSVVEKETTELFLQELIFEMSDYFLCVVNDFTSLDQRYLDKLTRNLQNSKKAFREVIVVHNCKEVIDEETCTTCGSRR